ncbi:transposon Tf2-9 polyprotein [Trichonephila clavipes]|nr:transposon Tf2-9 polyprotein [Trichonephila clavipes]
MEQFYSAIAGVYRKDIFPHRGRAADFFGGVVTYDHRTLFLRYIKNFAKRALPLTNLLRKDTPFEWTSETQEAFDDIKKAILNPPVLALPDPNAELQITTVASSRGIGAVLEQKIS